VTVHPDQIALGDIVIRSQWNCPPSLAVGDPAYVLLNTAYLADCSDINKMPIRGVVLSKPSPTTCILAHSGRVRIIGWGLTQGAEYFVGVGTIDVQSALPTADGTIIQSVGVAEDADTLMVTVTPEFQILGEVSTDREYDVGLGGVSVRDVVYISGNNQVDKADASNLSKMPAIGFVVSVVGAKCIVRSSGTLGGFAGLVANATYWVSSSVPGGIVFVAPNGTARIIQEVGSGLKADTLLVEIDRDYVVNPI
jgi:hypothetical protein